MKSNFRFVLAEAVRKQVAIEKDFVREEDLDLENTIEYDSFENHKSIGHIHMMFAVAVVDVVVRDDRCKMVAIEDQLFDAHKGSQ